MRLPRLCRHQGQGLCDIPNLPDLASWIGSSVLFDAIAYALLESATDVRVVAQSIGRRPSTMSCPIVGAQHVAEADCWGLLKIYA